MGYAGNQRLSLGAVEAVERHIHHMTKVGPGSLELRARRSEQQQSDAVRLLDDSRKQFQRGRIDPMQVLEEQQHWLASAQLMQPRSKRTERALLELARRQRGHWEAIAGRY